MRTMTICRLALAVALAFFSFPATACTLYDATVSANCVSYEIRADVGVGNPSAKISYSLTLTSVPGGEVVETIDEGPFDVPQQNDFRFIETYTGALELCGTYDLEGTLFFTFTSNCIEETLEKTLGPIRLVCPCDPGTGTPGYWKNHPEAWRVEDTPIDGITIGGKWFGKARAIELMKESKKGGNKALTMFCALVAAKLNVLVGNSSACVDDAIDDADAWMSLFVLSGGKVVFVKANSEYWQLGDPSGEDLYKMLDAYNNGLLCAPHRAGKLAAPRVESMNWGQIKNLSE